MPGKWRAFRPPAAAVALACAIVLVPVLLAHEGDIAVFSAASLDQAAPVAPNSIAVLAGEFDTRTVKAPDGVPQAELAAYTAVITGSDGAEHTAAIFAAEPRRLVILVPAVPAGTAHLSVMRYGLEVADGEFTVRLISPGLFTAAGSGGGLAEATAVRVNLVDGSATTEDVSFFNHSRGAHEPIPLNPAATDSELHLSLRGTGIRSASSLAVSVGGINVPARLDVATETSQGIDRVMVGPLPAGLAQRQLVDIQLTANGIPANPVQVSFSPSTGEAITFSNQIVRLFQGNCQSCHRPGQVAPFSLLDYQSAKDWAHSIKQATQSKFMPPWKPVPGYGEFMGARYLSDSQINLIARWVDAGAPEGEPEDLPEPLVFNEEWALGEPDLVLDTPSFAPDPHGDDEYRCFSVELPSDIITPRHITKVEVQPGNPQIVHHLILFGDPKGESTALTAASTDGKPGYECFGSAKIGFDGFNPAADSYILGGWAPGQRPQTLPAGSGYMIRPGSRIAIQLHYHPDGTEQADSTRIGLHFSDEPVEDNVIVLAAINTNFEIPPGQERYEVTASFSLDSLSGLISNPLIRGILSLAGVFPADIIGVLPHMHLLGKEIQMVKVSPSGERTPMIRIDDWDFDWQDTYSYVEPLLFQAEDRLEVTAIYDNSASNPWNPNSPPIPVGWGDRTTDEMCIVFFTVKIPNLCRFGICAQ